MAVRGNTTETATWRVFGCGQTESKYKKSSPTRRSQRLCAAKNGSACRRTALTRRPLPRTPLPARAAQRRVHAVPRCTRLPHARNPLPCPRTAPNLGDDFIDFKAESTHGTINWHAYIEGCPILHAPQPNQPEPAHIPTPVLHDLRATPMQVVGHPLLAPERLHARVHDGAGLRGVTQGRVPASRR